MYRDSGSPSIGPEVSSVRSREIGSSNFDDAHLGEWRMAPVVLHYRRLLRSDLALYAGQMYGMPTNRQHGFVKLRCQTGVLVTCADDRCETYGSVTFRIEPSTGNNELASAAGGADVISLDFLSTSATAVQPSA